MNVRRGRPGAKRCDAHYEGAKRGPFSCGRCKFWGTSKAGTSDADLARCNVPDRAAKNIPEFTERGGCCAEWDR